jgi:hypothetical protein
MEARTNRVKIIRKGLSRIWTAGFLRMRSCEHVTDKGRQVFSPEMRRRLQKFQSGQRLALLRPDHSRHSASQLFVRLQICQDQFLRATHLSGDWHESSVPAHVNRFRMLLERLAPHPPIEHHRHRRKHARASALFRNMSRERLSRLASKMRPARQQKFQSTHNNPHHRYALVGPPPQDFRRHALPDSYIREGWVRHLEKVDCRQRRSTLALAVPWRGGSSTKNFSGPLETQHPHTNFKHVVQLT